MDIDGASAYLDERFACRERIDNFGKQFRVLIILGNKKIFLSLGSDC